jgi:hypothetical protein
LTTIAVSLPTLYSKRPHFVGAKVDPCPRLLVNSRARSPGRILLAPASSYRHYQYTNTNRPPP